MAEVYGEDLTGILKDYPIEVTDIRTESYKKKKGVWWIKTPGGYRILKKHPNSDKTLDFVLAAVEHLRGKGIRTPEIIPNAKGGKYVIRDGCCYVLYQAISGVSPSYNKSEQLKQIVQELAEFHKASTGFMPPQGCKPRVHLGNWPDTYRSRNDKLISFYNTEEKNVIHGDFGETVLKEFPYFVRRARIAVDGLEGSEYRRWVEEFRNTCGLCHQDFAAGNLILTKAGELYVLDIDSITIDIPVRDIRKLLLKVMKKQGGWDLNLTKDMLAWYQSRNPLEYSRWQVLKWELMYPHLFSGVMSKYYEKREETWTQEKYLNRLKEMIGVEKTIGPVIEAFDGLIPK